MNGTSTTDCERPEADEVKDPQSLVQVDVQPEISDVEILPLENGNSNSENGSLARVEGEPTMEDEPPRKRKSIKKCLATSSNMIGSIIARLLFLGHSILCIVMAVSSIHQPYLYVLIAPLFLLVAEAYVTLKVRKNVEWKWFTPSIAIYQLCTVPSIWFLEFRQLEIRKSALLASTIASAVSALSIMPPNSTSSTALAAAMTATSSSNVTSTIPPSVTNFTNANLIYAATLTPDVTNTTANESSPVLSELLALAGIAINSSFVNLTSNKTEPLFAGMKESLLSRTEPHATMYNQSELASQLHDSDISHQCNSTSSSISPINLLVRHCFCDEKGKTQCLATMEQMLLLVMIVGRWLLPRGQHLSRDQKAQLLLVNIAIAADILELFELMKEEAVNSQYLLVTIVLTLWSCSLVQFAVVATTTAKKTWRGCSCFETEIWSLVTLLLLDDAPFLTFRLVCIIKYDVVSYNSYFFAAKNVLVLALDLNRIIALYKETQKRKRKKLAGTELDRLPHRASLSHIRR